MRPLPTKAKPLTEGCPVPGQEGKKDTSTYKYHPGETILKEAINEVISKSIYPDSVLERDLFEHIRYRLWGSGF